MNNNLNISALQNNIFWEDHNQNRLHCEEKFKTLQHPVDLIVLPEMFNTGFSMQSAKLFETMEGPTLSWMKSWAKKLNAALAGSIIIKENDSFYNRFLFVDTTGKVDFYDKRHLFRMAGEHHHFSAGNQQTIIELKGWKICLQICYDLRFPVWSRNTEQYDCLIYVANWPEPRNNAWKILLKARAIENQAYVIGVNRVGKDGLGINYTGDSAIISPKGDSLCEDDFSNKESVLYGELSYEELKEFRKKFPVSLDADQFQLTGLDY